MQINYEGNQAKFRMVRKRKEEIKERTVREFEKNEELMQGGNKIIKKSQWEEQERTGRRNRSDRKQDCWLNGRRQESWEEGRRKEAKGIKRENKKTRRGSRNAKEGQIWGVGGHGDSPSRQVPHPSQHHHPPAIGLEILSSAVGRGAAKDKALCPSRNHHQDI